MPVVSLRPATADDYDFAYGIYCAAMRTSVRRVFGWDEDFQARYFRLHFNPAKREIICYDRVAIGVFSVEDRQESLFVAQIAILPCYQNRGVGTTLIRRVQQRARKSNKSVTLQVLKGNRAQALYERLGFAVIVGTDTHIHMA